MKAQTYKTTDLNSLLATLPATANETIHSRCTPRYSLVSTKRVAESLLANSEWKLMGGKQGGTRIVGMEHYTRHSVLFSRPDLGDDILGVTPFIQFQNAHAGRGAAQARIGLYRSVCLNELMFGAAMEVKCSARHTGTAEDNILQAIQLVACRIPDTMQQIREWSKFDTTMDQRVELAEVGLTARFGEDRAKWAVDADAVLSNCRREEDRGYDLWTTLNVVQENILRPFRKGDENENGKVVPFRSVRAIATLNRINLALVEKSETICGLIS